MSAREDDIFLSVRGWRRVGVGNGAGVRTRGPLGEEADDDDGGLVSPARQQKRDNRGTVHVPHCRQRLSGCYYIGKACVAGKGAPWYPQEGICGRAKNN